MVKMKQAKFFGMIIIMLLAVIAIACTNQSACSKDARVCPDGSVVGRVPSDCEFEKCPSLNESKNDINNFEGCEKAG